MGWYTDAKRKLDKGLGKGLRKGIKVLENNAGTAGTAFGGTVGFVAAGPAGAALGTYLGGLAGRKFGREIKKTAIAKAAPDVAAHLKNVRATIEEYAKRGAKLVGGQEIVPGVVYVSENESAVLLSDQTVSPARAITVAKLEGSVSEQEAKEALATSLKTAALGGVVAYGVKKVLGG